MQFFQEIVSLLLLIVAGTMPAGAMQVNNLEEGESADGLSFGDKTKSYYIESKIGEDFTVGFQGADWKNGYGGGRNDLDIGVAYRF